MQISHEKALKNSITAYSDSKVKINNVCYEGNLIANNEIVLFPWNIKCAHELSHNDLSPIIDLNPEVILIGHKAQKIVFTANANELIAKKNIGIEIMNVGAACRTYNLLLSEYRNVVVGIILS